MDSHSPTSPEGFDPEDPDFSHSYKRVSRMSLLVAGPILAAVIFMVLLPKGGIKLSGVPLTWGCGIFGAVAGLAALGSMLKHRLPFMRRWFPIVLMLLPLQLLLLISFVVVGFQMKATMMAVVTGVIIFPYLYVLFLGNFLDTTPYFPFILNTLRWCIFYAALYGLLLFGVFSATGKFIEIRYVTTNGSEVGSVAKKNNTRGDMKKLTSSYNNGNIYGICTLMLLPLFTVLEKSAWKRIMVKGAVVLTLSRTVWVGIIFSEIICAFLKGRVDIRKLFRLVLVLVAAMIGIMVLLVLMGKGMTWLADENLGGRGRQFGILNDMSFLPQTDFYEISEVVYMAFLREFGLLGLATFLLYMAIPFVGYFLQKKAGLIKKACMFGALNYAVMATSDGAFMLIPTMAFFWFLCAVIWCRNPYLQLED